MARSLKDTPFSIDRLFVWTIGIIGLIGMVGMVTLALMGRTIPPQIQSATMFCLGVAAAGIKDRFKQ